MKTVSEKVVYEGLLVSLMFLNVKKILDFFYLFQCEKKRTVPAIEYVHYIFVSNSAHRRSSGSLSISFDTCVSQDAA